MARIVDSRLLVDILHNVGLSQVAFVMKGMITGLNNQQHESLMIALARFHQVEGHKAVEDDTCKKVIRFMPEGISGFTKTTETATSSGPQVHTTQHAFSVYITKQDIDWLTER